MGLQLESPDYCYGICNNAVYRPSCMLVYGNFQMGPNRMRNRIITIFTWTGFAGLLFWFLYAWNWTFTNNSKIVVYFGRPGDVLPFIGANWTDLFWASWWCFLTASISLVLAGLVAILLLWFGIISDRRLHLIERLAACSQTIPMLVIVAISLLIDRMIFALIRFKASADWYCLIPVTIALLFPPLINGAGAISRMPVQLKEMFRIWDAPSRWRAQRVYLPFAIPDVLTGIRASATWAISATLIAEGLVNGVDRDTATLGHSLMRAFSSTSEFRGKTLSILLIATFLGFVVYVAFAIVQWKIEKWLIGHTAIAEAAYPLQSGSN